LALKNGLPYDVVKYLLDKGEDITKSKYKYRKTPYEAFLENIAYAEEYRAKSEDIESVFR